MINHILLIVLSLIIYELIKYFKFFNLIKLNLKIYKKIIKSFNYKNVSDFRKEKLIFNYSKLLFNTSLKIFLIIALIIIVFYVLGLFSESLYRFIISIFGTIELIIIIIIYHQFRKKLCKIIIKFKSFTILY